MGKNKQLLETMLEDMISHEIRNYKELEEKEDASPHLHDPEIWREWARKSYHDPKNYPLEDSFVKYGIKESAHTLIAEYIVNASAYLNDYFGDRSDGEDPNFSEALLFISYHSIIGLPLFPIFLGCAVVESKSKQGVKNVYHAIRMKKKKHSLIKETLKKLDEIGYEHT